MFRELFEKSDPAKRYKELKKMSKENLISLFKQKNNVVNTKGVPKEDMISDILNDEFSRKEIEKAFGQNEDSKKYLKMTDSSFGKTVELTKDFVEKLQSNEYTYNSKNEFHLTDKEIKKILGNKYLSKLKG